MTYDAILECIDVQPCTKTQGRALQELGALITRIEPMSDREALEYARRIIESQDRELGR